MILFKFHQVRRVIHIIRSFAFPFILVDGQAVNVLMHNAKKVNRLMNNTEKVKHNGKEVKKNSYIILKN